MTVTVRDLRDLLLAASHGDGEFYDRRTVKLRVAISVLSRPLQSENHVAFLNSHQETPEQLQVYIVTGFRPASSGRFESNQ